jgi:putative membrane protein
LDADEKLVQGQAKANETASDLKKQLEQYIQDHPEARQDPGFQKIVAISNGLARAENELNSGQAQLAQGAKKLAEGQVQIEEGMNQFAEKMDQAVRGAKQLSDGTVRFAAGFSRWSQGFSALDAGIRNLANGEKQLDHGADKLADGLVRLTDGSNELSAKLNEAAKKTSSVHNDEERSSMFSEPVKLVKANISEVPNYGTGIAPYFLSLAFYVGGIMASNILPLGRRQDLKVTGTVHFINKLGLVYSIGLIQTLIVDMVALFGFKLHVADTLMFILSSLMISFTFMTFILMLVTVFGLVGKFAAVTLLVLQLATCGGTFPGELSIPLLREIGELLPMAHSLRGLQDVISLGDWSDLQFQFLILIGYLVVAAGIAWVASHLQHAKTPAEHAH